VKRPRSGQCEEELFQFCFGHGLFVVCGVAGHAFTKAGGHDLESGFVEGAGDGGELSDDVSQSRPFSIMPITPASWPCARRRRLSTNAMLSSSPIIAVS
jgi:hypothetical protein